MSLAQTRLFDFAPFVEQRESAREAIRKFLSHPAFRSAVVEELELDEDFYRRPLRPEDLEILPFKDPVDADTVSRLPALASNRMLLSIYELGVARLPRASESADEFERYAAFYGDENQLLAARVRPFLENFAFSHAAGERVSGAKSAIVERLDRHVGAELEFWRHHLRLVAKKDYLREALRFVLIQRWCLAPAARTGLAKATAAHYFDALAVADRPSLSSRDADDTMLSSLAESLGIQRRPHSYWQFYLATSLARLNLLLSLASRPDHALALYGAAFVAEADWLAFRSRLESACPHLTQGGAGRLSLEAELAELRARFGRALNSVEKRFGQQGLARLEQGLACATTMAAGARWDLGEQLSWLSSIDAYCGFAQRIEARIQDECPNIDRETFVEPREMCSTTHVHNDHRLVVIESGDMVFWGNLGMQLKMKVGDKVLIPQGRLHGSTVVSDECTYHQPIIPDHWVRALTNQLEAEASSQGARSAE